MAASQSVLEEFVWVESGETGVEGRLCGCVHTYACVYVYMRMCGYMRLPVQLRLLRQASERVG